MPNRTTRLTVPTDGASAMLQRFAAALTRSGTAAVMPSGIRECTTNFFSVGYQTMPLMVISNRGAYIYYRGSAHSPTNAVLTTWNATP